MKGVDTRLEETRKAVRWTASIVLNCWPRTLLSSVSIDNRDSLMGVSQRRLAQKEQANKALSTKVARPDIRASTTHINEMNKAVTGHLAEVQ